MDVTVQPGGSTLDDSGAHDNGQPEAGGRVPVWVKVVRRAGVVLLVAVVAAVLAVATAIAFLPAAANGSTMKVLSGSMEGTFSKGDVVVSKPVDADSIRPGDVITFKASGTDSELTQTVTHRVVEVRQGVDGPEFVTKGDANPINDLGTTTAADVKGKMWYHIPWVASARDAMFEPAGMFYGAGILMLLVGAHLLLPRGPRKRAENSPEMIS